MQMYANDVEQRHRRSGRARKVSYAPIARQMALAWRRTFPPHTKWPPSTFVMERWPGRSRDSCKWPAEVAQAVDWSARGAWLLIELWGPRGSKCTRPIKWSIIDVIAIDRWRWIVVHCSMWTRAPVPTMWKRTENSVRYLICFVPFFVCLLLRWIVDSLGSFGREIMPATAKSTPSPHSACQWNG